MNKDNVKGFGIGILAGIVAGGILGVLYAPDKGEVTRQQIRDQSGKFVAQVKDIPVKARAKMGKSTVDDMKHGSNS